MFCARPEIELHLVLLQNFRAGTKTEFTEWKSSFGLAQKVWNWHNMWTNILSGIKNLEAQNILGPAVERRGSRRTRHCYILVLFYFCLISFWCHSVSVSFQFGVNMFWSHSVLVNHFYFSKFILCPKNCHDVICTSTPQNEINIRQDCSKGRQGGTTPSYLPETSTLVRASSYAKLGTAITWVHILNPGRTNWVKNFYWEKNS